MKLFKFLLVAILVSANITAARADDAAAAAGAIVVMVGAVKGAQYLSASALQSMELEEWKDKRAKTTSVLGASCGAMTEFKLIGDNRNNYGWFIIKNETKETLVFDPSDVQFKFSSGVFRSPLLARYQEVFLDPGRIYYLVLPFPSKEDFAGQNSLTVSYRLKKLGQAEACVSDTVLARNPDVPDTPRTTVGATVFDWEFGLGASSLRGELKDYVSGSGARFNMDIYFWGAKSNGFYLGFSTTNLGDYSNVWATEEGIANDGHLQLGSFYLGYAHRHFITADGKILWRVGIGGYSLDSRNDDGDSYREYSGTNLDAQIGWRQRFANVPEGIWRGEYSWGIDLNSTHMFSKGRKNGQEVKGTVNSLALVFGLGY